MAVRYTLEMEIAGLPAMTNGARRTRHWALLAKEAKKWKTAVVASIRGVRPPQPLKRARLTLTRHSAVAPDPDGLVSGFKHVIDGLVLGRILANDRVQNIGMPEYRWVRAAPKQGKITVRVEELQEGEHASENI